jgi:asparagine synthase (glutamine-hydrolysing)
VGAAAFGLRKAGGRYARFADALQAGNATERYIALRTPNLDAALRRGLVRPPLRADHTAASAAVARHADGLSGRPVADALVLDAKLGLVDDMLAYSDRVSMAHSLEVRVPFLDHHVVELAARIPTSLKVRRGTTKYLVKQVARGLVPGEIVDKPKTGFFNHAVDQWVQAQLDGRAADFLLAERPASGEFLDRDGLRRVVVERRAGKPVSGDALYALLILEVWLSSFLPRALRRPGERVATSV